MRHVMTDLFDLTGIESDTGSDPQVIVPSVESDPFVALARTNQGRLFRKHILSKGPLIHPTSKRTIEIDDEFVSTLIDNFDRKVCDIVQVPLAGARNEHSEDPSRSIGEVVALEESGGKVYALMDIRDEDAATKLGRTMLGASAMLSLDYVDTRSGKRSGPTLLHTCVTNRPYVLDLDDYEELVKATSEGTGETVLLTPVKEGAQHSSEERGVTMTLDELKAALKADHGIDVDALEVTASLTGSLSQALGEAGVLTLTNGETVEPDDIVGAVSELATQNVSLSGRVEELEKLNHAAEVDTLVSQGYIAPAQRDAMLELRMSNSDLFERLVPDSPLVELSAEYGAAPVRQGGQEADIDAEIARLSASAAEAGYIR